MIPTVLYGLLVRLRAAGRAVGMVRAALLALVCSTTACAEPPAPEPLPDDNSGPSRQVYVVNHGWHSGIVVERAALPPGRVPEAADLPAGPFLEFGWGDREYYPSPQPTIGMALGAALAPGPAVMHVAALPAPPREVWPGAEILAFGLDGAAFARLVAGIDADFDRPEGGRAEAVANGLYLDSLFYPAKGRFHLFNTCNTWTVRQLAAAGLEVSPAGVSTVGELMSRLRRLPEAEKVGE